MRNNVPYKVIEIGLVRIIMFDGTIMTLTDVRHIPYLKKNPISLSTIDAKGYMNTYKGGVLKVSGGAFVAKIGKISSTWLYLLLESTVIGDRVVTTYSI